MRRELVIAIAAMVGALANTVIVKPFRTEAVAWSTVAGRARADQMAENIHRAVGVWPDTIGRCSPTRLYIIFSNPPFGSHGLPTMTELRVGAIASQHGGRAAEAAWDLDQVASPHDTITVRMAFRDSHSWNMSESSYYFPSGDHPLPAAASCLFFFGDSAQVFK